MKKWDTCVGQAIELHKSWLKVLPYIISTRANAEIYIFFLYRHPFKPSRVHASIYWLALLLFPRTFSLVLPQESLWSVNFPSNYNFKKSDSEFCSQIQTVIYHLHRPTMVVARERNCFLCFVKILKRLLNYATLTRPAGFSICLFKLLVERRKAWKFMQHFLWTFSRLDTCCLEK